MAFIGVTAGVLMLISLYVLLGMLVWHLLATFALTVFVKIVIMVFVISALVFFPAIMMGNSYTGEV